MSGSSSHVTTIRLSSIGSNFLIKTALVSNASSLSPILTSAFVCVYSIVSNSSLSISRFYSEFLYEFQYLYLTNTAKKWSSFKFNFCNNSLFRSRNGLVTLSLPGSVESSCSFYRLIPRLAPIFSI